MTDPAPRRSAVPGTALLVSLVLLTGASVAGVHYWRKERLAGRERSRLAGLKQLVVAEADFRANDRDANQVNDFWTDDVAGLYYLGVPTGAGGTQLIRLIEERVARADGARPDRVPYQGYFFMAMDMDEDGNPYRQNTTGDPTHGKRRNTLRFAFCAVPADYPHSGRLTFIVNEGHTIFRIDTRGRPVLRFPTDAELKSGFEILD